MHKRLNKEIELISKMKNGNQEAFSIIFEHYSPILYSFLSNFNFNHHDIEDCIQSTFLKLWDNRVEIEANKSLKNYLITLAKNDIYNKVKRNIIEQKYLNNIIPNEAFINDSYQELNVILLRILDQLPEKRATVYKMSRIEGKKNDEIAQELGLSKSTVENHINNSSSLIKKILKNLGFIFISIFFNFS